MTPNQFLRKLKDAEKGDQILYFRGYTGDLEKNNDDLRRIVAKCYIEDRIVMVQRKTGVFKKVTNQGMVCKINEFDYIAVKR